jgi:small subunit ribosomal protein S15
MQLAIIQDHHNAAQQYKVKKNELIAELQEFQHDTGTLPVQIGLLSLRIDYLTKHTEEHRKDHHTRRALHILLSRRRKQLKYLRKKDFDTYTKVSCHGDRWRCCIGQVGLLEITTKIFNCVDSS